MLTVLFDLDGTLLPMDQDVFVRDYFGRLARKTAPAGYDPKTLPENLWKGVAAMVMNDGSRLNEAVFWDVFKEIYGEKVEEDKGIFEDFYANEFQETAKVCGYNPKAKACVEACKEMGCRVVLATNPIFPAIATESRIRWAGLEPSDFEYYTTYENSRFSKPNLKYYEELLKKIQVNAGECLMVGNDVSEDMVAEKLGMKVFLLTDSMINKEHVDIEGYPHGDFDKLLDYIKAQSGQALSLNASEL